MTLEHLDVVKPAGGDELAQKGRFPAFGLGKDRSQTGSREREG